jgi:SNF2 family DNA or RNA helicase
MLNVALNHSNKKFMVTLDTAHPCYDRVYILIRSLLSSVETKLGWILNYDDLCYFKELLQISGLRQQGQTIDVEAFEWLQYLQKVEADRATIKAGADNERIKTLLETKLKSPLFEDQLAGVAYLVNLKRVGLFDAMGTGKSLQSLSASLYLDSRKTLIVAPKNVLPGFQKEVQKHTHKKAVVVPSGRDAALGFLRKLPNNWDYLLVHPENLIGSKKNQIYSPILLHLISMPWDMIIIDEFHKYKNIEAQRSQCILKLAIEARTQEKEMPRMIMMTGTPVPESPTNAYMFLKITNFGGLPPAVRFEHFFTIRENVEIYVRKKKGSQEKGAQKRMVTKITGYRNLDFLKTMIDRRSIRRTKEDLKGFPDKLATIRDIFLSGKQADLYRSLQGQLIKSLPDESKVNLIRILENDPVAIRMRQLLNHPAMIGESADSAKYDELESLLEELFADPMQKALVWTEYRKGVELLYDRFNALWGVQKIYGGVEITHNLIDRFEAADGPRIAAVIPAKGGEGLDFLARARTSFYIDRPYSATLYTQSLDRIHRRVMQKANMSWLDNMKLQPANLIFLDAVGTIDEIVRASLDFKQDLSDALLIEEHKLVDMGRNDLLDMLRHRG